MANPTDPFSSSVIPFEVPEQMRAFAEKGVSQARDNYAKFKDVASLQSTGRLFKRNHGGGERVGGIGHGVHLSETGVEMVTPTPDSHPAGSAELNLRKFGSRKNYA